MSGRRGGGSSGQRSSAGTGGGHRAEGRQPHATRTTTPPPTRLPPPTRPRPGAEGRPQRAAAAPAAPAAAPRAAVTSAARARRALAAPAQKPAESRRVPAPRAPPLALPVGFTGGGGKRGGVERSGARSALPAPARTVGAGPPRARSRRGGAGLRRAPPVPPQSGRWFPQGGRGTGGHTCGWRGHGRPASPSFPPPPPATPMPPGAGGALPLHQPSLASGPSPVLICRVTGEEVAASSPFLTACLERWGLLTPWLRGGLRNGVLEGREGSGLDFEGSRPQEAGGDWPLAAAPFEVPLLCRAPGRV